MIMLEQATALISRDSEFCKAAVDLSFVRCVRQAGFKQQRSHRAASGSPRPTVWRSYAPGPTSTVVPQTTIAWSNRQGLLRKGS
jgi:hypothetical protein